MAAILNFNPGSSLVYESEQGQGIGQAASDSGKRVAHLERRQRELEELGDHLSRSKARRRRLRAGSLLRVAIPLAILNLILVAASWVSLSSAIQATNRATAQLIKDIDRGNEAETQRILQGVQENNQNLLTQIEENRKVSESIEKITARSSGLIDTITEIQKNEANASAERQKLLESMKQLLIATGQQVEDVQKNTDEAARHTETLASQKPKVITKTVVKTRTKQVRPPTLYEKIFGTRKQSR